MNGDEGGLTTREEAGPELPSGMRGGVRARILIGAITVALVAAAWIVGSLRSEKDIAPNLSEVFPAADHFDSAPGGTYAAWGTGGEEPLGYVGLGEAQGYGGDLKVVVAVSSEGRVLAATVAAHRESPAFFQRVEKKGFLRGLLEKSYEDDFMVGQDVDGVTGATYTSRALADAVRRAGRSVAEKVLGLQVPAEEAPHVQFGWPEALLIGLFLLSFLWGGKSALSKKVLRWSMLGLGIALLGFVLNRPLNLVHVNRIIIGEWPVWQLNLYWYILLAGVFLFTLVRGASPYCEGICPFGAAQEVLGTIGGARPPGRRLNLILRWIQRVLALGLIGTALAFRNPSKLNFEVSGTLFELVGSTFHFVLLALVLVASLFIRRPWCRALCPLRPVTDFLRGLRQFLRGVGPR